MSEIQPIHLVTFPLTRQKLPAMKGWNLLEESVEHEEGSYYGIVTGKASGIFVLDVDMKNGKDGKAALAQLGEVPKTCTVQTPSGGLHLYFRYPENGCPTNAGIIGEGLDLRGDINGYVVGPGSPGYELIADVEPHDAPIWLLEKIRSMPKGKPSDGKPKADPIPEDHPDFSRRVAEARAFLHDFPPCLGGDTQDKSWLIGLALGGDLELPTDVAMALIGEELAPYCYGGWLERCYNEIERAIDRARCDSDVSAGIRALTQRAAIKPGRMPHLAPKTRSEPTPKAREEVPEGWADELDLTIDVPPTEWLIQGLWVDETVNILVAEGNSLKTWAALSMGLAVSKGLPWLNKYPTKKRNVLVLDYESGKDAVTKRLQKLALGKAAHKGIYYKRKGLGNLHEQQTWDDLSDFVKARNIGLVIIDSMAAGSGGVDENTTDFAKPMIDAGRLSDECHTSFLFIHHAGKGDKKGSEVMRGTSAIYAACDSAYLFINKEGDPRVGVSGTMKNIKNGDGVQEDLVHLFLAPDPGGLEVRGEPQEVAKTRMATPIEFDKQIYLKLKSYGTEGCPGASTLSRDMGFLSKREEQRIRDSLKRMLEDGTAWAVNGIHAKTNKKTTRWFA